MKKLTLIFFLILSVSSRITYSQFEFYDPDATKTKHVAGDFILSASPNVLFNTPNGVQFAGGLRIRAFISKRISVDGDIVFGRDYTHAGPGILGIPIGLLSLGGGVNSDGSEQPLSDFLFYLAAIVLSFEHMAYHIPLKNNIDIAPYISLMRFKSAYEYGSDLSVGYAGQQLSFATGVGVEKYFGRFVLSPYAEINVGYTDAIPGVNIGVYFGILFPVK